jgi:hypothetical protein
VIGSPPSLVGAVNEIATFVLVGIALKEVGALTGAVG